LEFDDEHDKEELTSFIEKSLRHKHIVDIKDRKGHAMYSAYGIWSEVKKPLKDKFEKKDLDVDDHFMDKVEGNISAIDSFFDLLRSGHKQAEERWKSVWKYTQLKAKQEEESTPKVNVLTQS
jgi:hypothetical protein